MDFEHHVVFITGSVQRITGKGLVFQTPKSARSRLGINLDEGTEGMLGQLQGLQLLHKGALEGAYRDQGLIFAASLGEPLDPGVATHNWGKVAHKAGYLHVGLHDLRHHHAAGLIREGVPSRVIQDRLGHASAAFTMQVYGHVAAGLQQEAATAFANLMENSSG